VTGVRFKVVPPPRSVGELRAMARALPAVPRGEADCCAILLGVSDLTARDDARSYLTFLRALELLAVDDDRYYRVRPAPDDETLARSFRERVFVADAVLDALPRSPPPVDSDAPEPVGGTAADAFAAVRDRIPQWERSRHQDWEATWRDRVGELLGWAVELGLAERVATGTEPRYCRRADAG